ncbi:MAG TPA: DUF2254 domain-containing protein [Methylomirabilota bacterium]|nr:DUF2254 domain-containing protein [Methylomirabilota bacterium]
MARLLNLWDALRGSFWFLPALITALAAALALGLLALDRRLDNQQLAGLLWLYAGGAEGARSLLSAVAGSIITVVGLAFSITIVSLQLAAAQLGPRLLRNFVRDPGNQVVLGIFVATFVYCLLVLRTVRGRDGLADGTFVPHLAITGALGLAMLSVALLIYFIHHASISIQADHVIASVARELDGVIDKLWPDRFGHEDGEAAAAPPCAVTDGSAVAAHGGGYVTTLDEKALLRAGRDRDVVVHLTRRPGDFLMAGEPLAWVLPADRVDEDLKRVITSAVVLGAERSLLQDAMFGIEQLVEIAVRALASGHIDPTTGLRCIDRLGAAVARIGGRDLPAPYRRDAAGIVRVVMPALTLDDIVVAAFTPIRLQGAGSRSVALRLLETFARVAARHDRRGLHLALLGEALRVRRAATAALTDPADREAVQAAFERVLRVSRPDARRDLDVGGLAA